MQYITNELFPISLSHFKWIDSISSVKSNNLKTLNIGTKYIGKYKVGMLEIKKFRYLDVFNMIVKLFRYQPTELGTQYPLKH